MNSDEFYNEFNLVYNNISSNQAPGLDKYEISVYLTKAQEALVDSLYTEFEKSEEARRNLASLVKTSELSVTVPEDDNVLYPEYTLHAELRDDLNIRYIINEQLKLKDEGVDACIAGKHIDIKPCMHDELDSYVKNPYRFNNRRALRLDTSLTGNTQYIELLLTKPTIDTTNSESNSTENTDNTVVDYYKIRYVQNPDPIILDVFTDVKINGKQNSSEITYLGSLPEHLHRRIVEIAARMAYQDYKN